MTDQPNNLPPNDGNEETPPQDGVDVLQDEEPIDDVEPVIVVNSNSNGNHENLEDEEMGARLERLGGEPAPDITPEEFASLQQNGQIHIDPRGRVRSSRQRQSTYDAGVSLRKRRAWYI